MNRNFLPQKETFFKKNANDPKHMKMFSITNSQENANQNKKIATNTIDTGIHQNEQVLVRKWQKFPAGTIVNCSNGFGKKCGNSSKSKN